MKKIISILICLSLIFTTCAFGVTAHEVDYTVSGGNVADSDNISADEFAQKVSALIEKYDMTRPLTDDDFALARLIIKSTDSINVDKAVAVVSGYDNLWVLQYDTPEDAKEAFEFYKSRPEVEFVEADKPVNALSTTGNGVAKSSVDFKYISWGPSHIGIDNLNKSIKYNYQELDTIYVAVVDTGVCANHEYLQGRVEPTRINTSGSGERNSSEDDNGHGTQVAGVIVDATLDNIIIKPYKVLDQHGNGTHISLAAGINCAVKDKVDVINISVGFYDDSEVLKAAIDNATENDIVVIAAAGNDNTDKPMYPSSYDNVIRVAASNERNIAANFSNYGDIDIAAPGVDIMTSSLNNGYYVGSGTSLASPLVAAAAATILIINNNASPEDIKFKLKELAVESFVSNAEETLGAGILNMPAIDNFNYTEKTSEPEFSKTTAIYREEFELTITCDTPDSVIYYTTDETLPSKTNKNALIYDKPIKINKTTKILAVAYAENHYRSNISSFSAIVAPYADESELTVDSNGVLTAYTGSAKSLSIPETVNGITVKKLGDGILKNRGLTELILPRSITAIGKESVAENPELKSFMAFGVTSIDERAFYNCIWLKNIYLNEIKFVGEYAFYNVCSKAYELYESTFALDINNLSEIPEGAFMNSAISEANVDVPLTLGKNAFYNCNALVNINFADLQNLDDGAFRGLKALRDVYIGKLETIPIGAFSTCEMLEHIHLPAAEYVDSHAFENCASLQLIDLPLVKTIYSNAFSGCDSLYEINLESATGFEPDAYTSNIAPSLPKNLTVFNAPKFEKTPNRMFYNCAKIQVVYLSSATELGLSTFNGCKSIYYIDISGVKYINGDIFGNCSATAINARSLVSSKNLPSNSGIILSNEFVEAQGNAENLIVYGTPGTYVERYSNYKGYTFIGIPLIINDIPDYITENSEMITIEAVGFDLEYQWYWNSKNSTEGGTQIKGANDKSYTFTQNDTAPFYYCKITHHDVEKDVIIYSDIIIKDSTPADYSAYNKAVEAANAIDRSLYVNINILDEALAIDVSNRYSCEQEYVDAQTKAIYDAISALKHNGVEKLIITIANTEVKLYEMNILNYMVNPVDADYNGISWSCEQNQNIVLLNKNGYVRFIDSGEAVIRGEVINPDGEVISTEITVKCEISSFEKLFVKFFKPFWILIYAMSGQRI